MLIIRQIHFLTLAQVLHTVCQHNSVTPVGWHKMAPLP